jgi:hypothetical protein
MIDQHLEALGISSDLPAAEKAAELVRRFALRLGGSATSRDVGTILESGWFAGEGECVRVLAEVYHGTTRRGAAFGGPWPFLEAGNWLLAPAVPTLVGDRGTSGPDGEYRLQNGQVLREAVGQEQPLLATDPADSVPGKSFDLLWFGEGERFLARDGVLEIEDLFSLLRLPLDLGMVDRFLLRARRVEPTVAHDLVVTGSETLPTMEVRRDLATFSSDVWRDPCRLYSARVGVRSAERIHDQLVVEMDSDRRVVFNIVEDRNGWSAFTWEGSFLFQTLALIERGGVLSLTGTLSRSLDPLEPGLRGRLAFDLNADLVALSSG